MHSHVRVWTAHDSLAPRTVRSWTAVFLYLYVGRYTKTFITFCLYDKTLILYYLGGDAFMALLTWNGWLVSSAPLLSDWLFCSSLLHRLYGVACAYYVVWCIGFHLCSVAYFAYLTLLKFQFILCFRISVVASVWVLLVGLAVEFLHVFLP